MTNTTHMTNFELLRDIIAKHDPAALLPGDDTNTRELQQIIRRPQVLKSEKDMIKTIRKIFSRRLLAERIVDDWERANMRSW